MAKQELEIDGTVKQLREEQKEMFDRIVSLQEKYSKLAIKSIKEESIFDAKISWELVQDLQSILNVMIGE